MKKQWARPEAKVQEFVANEYVAACTWSAECNVDGNIEPIDGGLYRGYCNDCDDRTPELSEKPKANATLDGVTPIYAWGNMVSGVHGATLDSFKPSNAS